VRWRAYLRIGLLWVLLAAALALFSRRVENLYLVPIARVGEAITRLAVPADVGVAIRKEKEEVAFDVARGNNGLTMRITVKIFDASASVFIATVLLTPLGSVGRRALGIVLGLAGFVLFMGLLMAGLTLEPLVKGGFLSSTTAWRLAALAHNAATSNLIISFPVALWFLSTFPWWRRGSEKQKGKNVRR
jgi:hypothetical protein